jgi:synaptosomal-associated protein 29
MAGRQKNPFYDSNEVDDDDFLRKPRSNYMLPQHSAPAPSMQSSSATNTLSSDEDRRQMLMRARREIEERTLQSSSNSLGLLYESEKVGVATAEELAKQKEQLKATEQRLDDISATLVRSLCDS